MSDNVYGFVSMATIGKCIPDRGWDKFPSLDDAVNGISEELRLQCLLSAIVDKISRVSLESEFAAARSNRKYFKIVLRMIRERFDSLMSVAESEHGPCPKKLRSLISKCYWKHYPNRARLRLHKWEHEDWEPYSIEEWREMLAEAKLPPLWRLQDLDGFGEKAEEEYARWMKRRQRKSST